MSQPTHICFVETSGSTGGPIASLADLIEGLQPFDAQISVLLPDEGLAALRERVGVIEIHSVALPHGFKRDLRMASKLRRMISRGRTIVHANSTSAIRPALLATVGSRVPLVVHLRNSALSQGERALLRAAFARRPRNFHAIAVSESAAAQAGKEPGRKLSVLPDPVKAPLQRGDRPWSSPIRVGVVVSGSETKGFDNLVRVAQATTDLPVAFHIFGTDRPDSDSSFKSRWFQEAERVGASSKMLFHGRPPSLHTQYQTLDLVLIVSRRESFGRVAVEAMRAGVPVIAPDIDGLRETVGQGRYAEMYAPTDDGIGAAAALRKVLGDDGTAHRRAREALIWAARFDPSRAADSVIAVYERLLRSPIRGSESLIDPSAPLS